MIGRKWIKCEANEKVFLFMTLNIQGSWICGLWSCDNSQEEKPLLDNNVLTLEWKLSNLGLTIRWKHSKVDNYMMVSSIHISRDIQSSWFQQQSALSLLIVWFNSSLYSSWCDYTSQRRAHFSLEILHFSSQRKKVRGKSLNQNENSHIVS